MKFAIVFAAFSLMLVHGDSSHAGHLFVEPLYEVNVTNDIQYGSSLTGSGINRARFLDLYEPMGSDLPSELPAIVLMHGGFFTSGDKSSMSTYANAFASRGYVAVSINYRLLLQDDFPNPPGAPLAFPPSRYPSWLLPASAYYGVTVEQYFAEIGAAVADQGMAVNWLADNANTYNLDPQMIAAGGFSAGAISSLLLGAGAVNGVQADVGAVISFAGAMFGLETFVDASDPGVFIIHGDQDTTVPFSEVGFLQAALTSANVPFESVIVAGGGHSSFPSTILSDPDPLFEFMIDQLDPHVVPEPSIGIMLLFLVIVFSLPQRYKRNCDDLNVGEPEKKKRAGRIATSDV